LQKQKDESLPKFPGITPDASSSSLSHETLT